MSTKSFQNNKNDSEIVSEQEKQYIRQLQNKKNVLQRATNQKYKSMLQNCYQMEEIGNNINVNLKGQTQKLQKIHDTSDKTKKILEKANETSKQMASFWYSMAKKIKRVFVKNKQDDQQFQSQSIQGKDKNTIESKNQKSINFDESNFTKCQNHSQKTNQQQQNNEDAYLDEITNHLRKLKNLSKGTNEQLTKQHGLIDSLDKKTDQNSHKMNQINKRIVKKFF